jgi:hypothetical protein
MESLAKIFRMPREAIASPHIDELFNLHHKILAPKAIAGLLGQYVAAVQVEVDKLSDSLLSTSQHNCVSLQSLIIPCAFNAAGKAIFGCNFPVEATFKPFYEFDNSVHLFAAGLPGFLLPGPCRAWADVLAVFESLLATPHVDASDYIKEVEENARSAGWVRAYSTCKTLKTWLFADA